VPDDLVDASASALTSTVQLHQLRAPLADGASVFASDNPPIVLLPTYAQRLRNDFLIAAGIAIAVGIVGGFGLGQFLIFAAGAVVCLALLVLAIMRAFLVRVPEGTIALLNRGGKFAGELGAGSHRLPPWVIVSYLVTKREIPYDTPVLEVPTQDNVRASIDTLLTFAIVDARRFVFSISAPDFDRVLAAASQDAVRMIARGIAADRIADLARQDSTSLAATLSATVEPYGVEIRQVLITHARPSDEFVRSREGERLATIQRAEQAEHHALQLQRQADQDALARQQVTARLERERQELESQLAQAEMRRRVAATDVEAETVRLAKLDTALRAYPLAADWETQGARLQVSRALAGNTRAVVQIGPMEDIAGALARRDRVPNASQPQSPSQV
jgi:regulator of protease activity HflC (stomatin/prohibitin superfamily)